MMAQPDLLTTAFRMFFALAVVLGLLVLGYYGLRRFTVRDRSVTGRRMVQVVSSTYIGVKKQVSLVKVPGAVLVLGVTTDRIDLLTRIDDPDLVEAICDGDASGETVSFARQLQKFSSGIRGIGNRK